MEGNLSFEEILSKKRGKRLRNSTISLMLRRDFPREK
jgi:hypothetical protein